MGTRTHSVSSAKMSPKLSLRLPPFVHPALSSGPSCASSDEEDAPSPSDGWKDESPLLSEETAELSSSDSEVSDDRSHTPSPSGKMVASHSRSRCIAPMRAAGDRHCQLRGVTSPRHRGVTSSNPPLGATRRTRISLRGSGSSGSASIATVTIRGMAGRGCRETAPTAERCTKNGRDGTWVAPPPRRMEPLSTDSPPPVARDAADRASRRRPAPLEETVGGAVEAGGDAAGAGAGGWARGCGGGAGAAAGRVGRGGRGGGGAGARAARPPMPNATSFAAFAARRRARTSAMPAADAAAADAG